MRLVLIGPPGSGKGTQGKRLAAETGAQHIATGDLLRAEVQAGTKRGRAAVEYLDRGELVPDRVLLELVVPLVFEAADGYILDGFPRSVAQAMSFDQQVGEAAVGQAVYLRVPRAGLVTRMLHRAGEQGRSDDTEEVIVHRLRVFDQQTSPLIDHYRQHGLLTMVDGGLSPDEVYAELRSAVELD